jgi:hypothetical protein
MWLLNGLTVLLEVPKAMVKPTRSAVRLAPTSLTQSLNESQDQSIRLSLGSGNDEKMRSATVSMPNLSK